MTDFQTAYNQLNSAQKQAVDTIEGPLLVVAGPGTGKTQLLSSRVGNILQSTDASASQILCLTFTNKAATNMRDRLQRLIGPEGRHVVVRTFHSFAADIMENYPEYFWNGAKLQVAPEAVQLNLIETVLRNLPLDNPLAFKFAGKFTAVNDVQQALKLTKEAGLTPDKLAAIIDLNRAYLDTIEPILVDLLSPTLSLKRVVELQSALGSKLPDQGINEQIAPLVSLKSVIIESLEYAYRLDEPTGKSKNVGAWKRRWLQSANGSKAMYDERRRNQWWRQLADVYTSYRQQLHDHEYYDYADMLVEVISQLEVRADFRAQVQEQFLYVMLDEFQDTNSAQMRLAQLVAAADDIDSGSANIMAVGDDDQSIFKFNGAELNNMLEFSRTYPTSKTIVLTDNYRSSQAILDAAAAVIAQSSDRLVLRRPELRKDLRAVQPKFAARAGQLVHRQYETREQQFSAIAAEIKDYIDGGQGSVAVLARGHDSLRQIAAVLNDQAIAVTYEQSGNILDNPAVQIIVRLATVVNALQTGDTSTVDYQLAHIVRHPMWSIDPAKLWHLAAQNFGRRDWLQSILDSEPDIAVIGHWLLWLVGEAETQPLAVILEYLIGLRAGEQLTSPFRTYYFESDVDQDYVENLSAIRVLRQQSNEFGSAEHVVLADFITMITALDHNNRIVSDTSSYVAQAGVELLTVYKAKGLEFDRVYIIDAIEKNWQPRSGGRKPPANLPLQPVGDDADDYARLMFVAVTRARQDVIATSYQHDITGNELLPSGLLAEALPVTTISLPTDQQQLGSLLEQTLRWPRLSQVDELSVLRSRLVDYRLSATHLLNFLDLSQGGPEHFLERNLLNLPEAQSTSMAFGNAIHSAMETAQRLTNKTSFTLEATIAAFKRSLYKQRLPLTDYERYLTHGEQVLQQLFDKLHYQLPVNAQPELTLDDIRVGDCRLDGKLDRVEFENDQLTIIDYKTGKPLGSFYSRDQAKQVKIWRYKTQLTFYCLLTGNDNRFRSATTTTTKLVFPEAETLDELEQAYVPASDEIDRLQQLSNNVYQRIISLNLPDVTNYSPDITGIRLFEQDILDGAI